MIIFSLIICAVIFGISVYWSREFAQKKVEVQTLKNKLSLLKEGGASYFRWQSHPFLFYLVSVSILLFFVHFWLYKGFSFLVPITFIVGTIVAGIVSYYSTYGAYQVQNAALADGPGKNSFSNMFKGSSVVAIGSIALVFLVASILCLIVGAKLLLFYALGICFVAVFSQINGGIFAKSFEIATQIVNNDFDLTSENDERNPADWGAKVGVGIASVSGNIVVASAAYIFAFIGIVSFSSSQNAVSMAFLVNSLGLISAFVGVLFTTYNKSENYQRRIIVGMYISVLLIALAFLGIGSVLCMSELLPSFYSIVLGLVAVVIVCHVSEHYGSPTQKAVKNVARKSQFTAINSMLSAVAYGMKSMFFPFVSVCIAIFLSYQLGGTVNISLMTIGMISLVGIIHSANVFHWNVENVKNIFQIEYTDQDLPEEFVNMDMVGDSGHGVSLGYTSLISFLSSLLVLLMFGQNYIANFVTGYGFIAAFVVAGAFMPYIFMYFVIKGINNTSASVYEETYNQLKYTPYLMENKTAPNVTELVKIAIRKAQQYTFIPSMVAIFLPVIIGILSGIVEMYSFLLGSLVSGSLMALALSNTGLLLCNVKKYIARGNFGGKGTGTYSNSIMGAMLGSPLKDAVAPSIDIFNKIMILFAVILYPLFG